jgi:hypothetical protein
MTTKAVVLEDDPECKGLVALSVYNTKPVHFLICFTNLCWKGKKRVYDEDSGINVVMKFLYRDARL